MRALDDIARRLREREAEMTGFLTAEQARRLYDEGVQLHMQLEIRRAELRREYLTTAGEQNWAETTRGSVDGPPANWGVVA